MSVHTVKHDYKDGEKLTNPVSWCGKTLVYEFHFLDTHHLALAVGGSHQPCKNCIKAIIKELEKEL